MKTQSLTVLLAACGLAFHHGAASAQDNPKPPPSPDSVKPTEPRGGDRREGDPQWKHRDGDRGNSERHNKPQPEMKPTAFIGVFTRSLSDEVRAQTGLAPGFGLIVEEVMPDSPAQKAGLQQHDVLVLLGDQKLVNQDQLSALVRAEKKDSEITFTLKRAGAEQKVMVKVGEKMMPVVSDRDMPRPGSFNPFGMFGGRDAERFGDEMREQAEHFREGMKQFQDRIQDWTRGPKDRPVPQPPQFGRDGERGSRPQGRPPGDKEASRPQGDVSVRSSSSSDFRRNVVRRDDTGEYSLTDNNGARIFTVKPAQGEEQTFIVNTDEQRQAVPEQFRAKLRELENVDGKVKPDAPAPPPVDPAKPGI
jgi:hypothetical protein